MISCDILSLVLKQKLSLNIKGNFVSTENWRFDFAFGAYLFESNNVKKKANIKNVIKTN